MGHQGPPGAKKGPFQKASSTTWNAKTKVFKVCFEFMVPLFGPPQIPKALENGPLWDKKMGQKWVQNVFLQKCTKTIWGS